VRAVGWACSVGLEGYEWSRGEGIPGWEVGIVWQGACGDWEGAGREPTVSSMGGGSGGVSWRAVGQNS